jgi:hypothetical protein
LFGHLASFLIRLQIHWRSRLGRELGSDVAGLWL